MIAAVIRLCIANRLMVLLLTGALLAAGLWTTQKITVDAIPDLSDVQVIIRSEFPGQAPQIVEDQVTYPLTTAMLAVPGAETVRGYSMFGSSFVYIIFDDGTDMYWARSRVLEQLSAVTSVLPEGVTPQLGPDATGVGWIYEYVLETGAYCSDHPQGLWQDPMTKAWYADPDEAGTSEVQERLVHHRIFPNPQHSWRDPENGNTYADPDLAPEAVRDRLQVREWDGVTGARCPLTGKPLVASQVDLSQLRSLQDWYLRFELTTVKGVSEVAPVGGMVRQYQVTVDPVAMQARNIGIDHIRMALRASNQDVGGRLLEQAETEFMIQGKGYLGSLSWQEQERLRAAGIDPAEARKRQVIDDLGEIVLKTDAAGSPVRLGDIATIAIGPEIRRGIVEWNGQGETVGAIIVMRSGENARDTITAVKQRIDELRGGLPPGVDIVTAYDRTHLIDRAVHTLTGTLIEEIAVVSFVVLLFLLHARSALVAILVLPTGVLATILVMHLLDINANIMSLGGIAIAIGVMVDSAIIMVENAHKVFERDRHRCEQSGEPPRPRTELVAEAAAEVGPTLFFSLLIITVSFLPVFVLTGQSGRLFAPLAYTKTFAMGIAAVISITIIPVAMSLFISERMLPVTWNRTRALLVSAAIIVLPAVVLATLPMESFTDYRWWMVAIWVALSALFILPQRFIHEDRNPLSRILQAMYRPVYAVAMRFKVTVVIVALVAFGLTMIPLSRLGTEFMPPLEEGDFLYMPNTDPGISITKAKELIQQTDKIISQFPEVATVMGKIGRAETATDPAPLTMIETTITLEPDKSRWRQVDDYWLGFIAYRRAITLSELTDGYRLPGGGWVPGINESLQIPGLTGAITPGSMPIRTRIDMLATGIRTPIGIKVMGPDLTELSRLTDRIQSVMKTDPDIAPITASVAADRSIGGSYIDLDIDRRALARHGLTTMAVQQTIMSTLGGVTLTHTVEGRERYPVNLRYPRELRDDLDELRRVLVPTPNGAHIPLGQLAAITERPGPPMIRSENARLTSWLYVTPSIDDMGGYVAQAKEVIRNRIELPPGYSIVWSGQFEYMQEATENLMVAIPLAFMVIVLLLYMATRSWIQTGIVLLAVPFSAIGAVWMLYALDYNFSVAVAVGLIALAGLDAETGLVMLHYLQDSCQRFKREGRLLTTYDLWWAIQDGAVQRIRPKTMTVVTTFVGLMPLMFATGAGADTMRRLAAPMIGGLATSFIAELVLYPILWYAVMRRQVVDAPSLAGSKALPPPQPAEA